MSPFIIHEDEDLLVISKPDGITVNRADTTRDEETVQDWSEKKLHIENVSPEISEEEKNTYNSPAYFAWAFQERGGIVHRLDKETSGILLLAKNPDAFAELQQQFRERTVQKFYTALAHGDVTPSEGEINVPVGRLPWNRKQFGVVAGGREAQTYYTTKKRLLLTLDKKKEPMTLLSLEPKTGRTHQIRVHLQYIHHPIFADFLYAGRKASRDDREVLGRVFLHASSITFKHPRTGEKLHFTCPLTPELQNILEKYCKTRED